MSLSESKSQFGPGSAGRNVGDQGDGAGALVCDDGIEIARHRHVITKIKGHRFESDDEGEAR